MMSVSYLLNMFELHPASFSRQDIKVIVATARAFSALRGDGRVITWGRVVSGGESRHGWDGW